MKRFLSLMLALCLCLLTFVGCAEESEDGVPDGMLRAANSEMDLWLFYPEAWSIAENGATLRLVSAEQSSLENLLNSSDLSSGAASLPSNLANVSVTCLKAGVTDLAAYAGGEYRESFSERFVFDSEGKESKHGADDALTFTYALTGETGEVLYRYSQELVLHKESVYALTFTATEELYENQLASFEDICRSLTFEAVAEADNSPLTNPVDATVAESAENVPVKEGLEPLTNAGVDYVLYYPKEEFEVSANTGFSAVRASDGATVSVARGDAYSVQITDPATYLDEQFYPAFDALYGAHTELSRTEGLREDSMLLTVSYEAEIGGEDYTFLQAMYLRQGYIYTLLYTAKSDLYPTHFDAVCGMIEAFTFK